MYIDTMQSKAKQSKGGREGKEERNGLVPMCSLLLLFWISGILVAGHSIHLLSNPSRLPFAMVLCGGPEAPAPAPWLATFQPPPPHFRLCPAALAAAALPLPCPPWSTLLGCAVFIPRRQEKKSATLPGVQCFPPPPFFSPPPLPFDPRRSIFSDHHFTPPGAPPPHPDTCMRRRLDAAPKMQPTPHQPAEPCWYPAVHAPWALGAAPASVVVATPLEARTCQAEPQSDAPRRRQGKRACAHACDVVMATVCFLLPSAAALGLLPPPPSHAHCPRPGLFSAGPHHV